MTQILLKDRNVLPSLPGIYFVSRGDAIVYLGRTKNVSFRWNKTDKLEHHKLSELEPHDTLTFIPLSDLLKVSANTLLTKLELKLIKLLKPRLNVRGNC